MPVCSGLKLMRNPAYRLVLTRLSGKTQQKMVFRNGGLHYRDLENVSPPHPRPLPPGERAWVRGIFETHCEEDREVGDVIRPGQINYLIRYLFD